MTSKDLLEAAMRLDDKYIQEADARAAGVVPSKRSKIRIITGMTAAAACLTAVVGFRIHNIGMTEQSSTAESEVAEMTESETTAPEAAESETTRSEAKEAGTTETPSVTDISSKAEKPQVVTSVAALAEKAGKGTAHAVTTAAPTGKTTKKNTTTSTTKKTTAPVTTTTTAAKTSGETKKPVQLQIVFEKLLDYGVIGNYHMELRENGKLRFTGPTFDPDLDGVEMGMVVLAEGTGTVDYDAVLVREKTGAEAVFSKFRVNYDKQKVESVTDSADAALTEITHVDVSKIMPWDSGHRTQFHFLTEENKLTREIKFMIPRSAKGSFEIKAVADNGLDEASSRFSGASEDVVAVELNNVGYADYLFSLSNLENGKTVPLFREKFNFDSNRFGVCDYSGFRAGSYGAYDRYLFDAFCQVDGIDTETVYGGDFDYDGRITAADHLMAEVIWKADKENVLDMLPLSEELLARADILPPPGVMSDPSAYPCLPLYDNEREAIRNTWAVIRDCGCSGLSVEGYLANREYYDGLEQQYQAANWEATKDQIDWTQLGLSAVPTYEEFLMLTNDEYMWAHTDDWESLSPYEEEVRIKDCYEKFLTYEAMRQKLTPVSAEDNASRKVYDYIMGLVLQRYGYQAPDAQDPPTWEELLSMIEQFKDQ